MAEPHSDRTDTDASLDDADHDPQRPAPDATAFHRRRMISWCLVGGALVVVPIGVITQVLPGPLSIQTALWVQYGLWVVAALGALIISSAVTSYADVISVSGGGD